MTDIVSICTAYESGYGHGYDQRDLTNPYTQGSNDGEAWEYGYSEGAHKRGKHEANKERNRYDAS